MHPRTRSGVRPFQGLAGRASASALGRTARIALPLLAVACSGSYNGPGGITGGISSTLVSAELSAQPMAGLDGFELFVSGVQLVNAADTTNVFTLSRTTISYNLLTLPGTLGTLLGPFSVPQGDYFLRLLVDSARIAFKPPTTFANGDTMRTLAAAPGLHGFNAVHPVTLSGSRVTYVVALDPGRSIVYSGTAGHPTSATLQPLFYAIVDTTAVSIAGTVSPAAGHDTLYAVVGADTMATAFNDTTTGAFTLRLVPSPDSVTIRAHGNAFAASRVVVTQLGRDTTGITIP